MKQIRCSADVRLPLLLETVSRFPNLMLSRRYLVKEASIWRYALAQQLASHYCANPKVAAVIVEGSVTRGYADPSSDIDLAVFWTEPPAEKERRDIIKHAGGRRWQLFPYNREEACWSEEFEVTGVKIGRASCRERV